jgi:hypothetical protein
MIVEKVKDLRVARIAGRYLPFRAPHHSLDKMALIRRELTLCEGGILFFEELETLTREAFNMYVASLKTRLSSGGSLPRAILYVPVDPNVLVGHEVSEATKLMQRDLQREKTRVGELQKLCDAATKDRVRWGMDGAPIGDLLLDDDMEEPEDEEWVDRIDELFDEEDERNAR